MDPIVYFLQRRFLTTAVALSLFLGDFARAAPCTLANLGVRIGGNLPRGYEVSGVTWHPRLQKLLLVSDGGVFSSMNSDGSEVQNWSVGGDLEGVGVAQPDGDLVYLGVEHRDGVREFNMATGRVARSFDLSPWMNGPANAGLEALTFVPDANNPEGGLFYAGLQADGAIFVFQLPIQSSRSSTAVRHIRTIPSPRGTSDLSDMYYDATNGVLYAIYDSADLLRAMKPDGTLLKQWSLPGSNQEGVAIVGADLYIGEDYGTRGDVVRYVACGGIPEPDALSALALSALTGAFIRCRPRAPAAPP